MILGRVGSRSQERGSGGPHGTGGRNSSARGSNTASPKKAAANPRKHALEILQGLDKLINALRVGCERAADPAKLDRREQLLRRATELRAKLVAEFERLPSAEDDDPA
jgi:hypothetical protein